jgi:hypothetical protein
MDREHSCEHDHNGGREQSRQSQEPRARVDRLVAVHVARRDTTGQRAPSNPQIMNQCTSNASMRQQYHSLIKARSAVRGTHVRSVMLCRCHRLHLLRSRILLWCVRVFMDSLPVEISCTCRDHEHLHSETACLHSAVIVCLRVPEHDFFPPVRIASACSQSSVVAWSFFGHIRPAATRQQSAYPDDHFPNSRP